MTLYAATSNAGKLMEFTRDAAPELVEVMALPGLAGMAEPVEDALTFAGNAEIKAREYSLLVPGLLVFADDSGLEVDALGGPGVRSARFADDLGFEVDSGAGRDERNNRALLQQLGLRRGARPKEGFPARFVCALALARDGEILLRSSGSVEGLILDAPQGEGGFGYDPLFLLPSMGLTLAEISGEAKWRISHRGVAFRALLMQLKGCALEPAQ